MNILVCISHVPDTTSKISFSEGNSSFNKEGVQYIIGPYDDYSLARAVELKETLGAKVTVLNVGFAETEATIRKALAIGADEAIRVNADPLDALFVSEQIAKVVKQGEYDLVLMGRESIDFNGGQVHAMVGELLGMPAVSPVMKLDINGNTATMSREIEGGIEHLEVDLPFVAGCQEPIAEWKIPNMRGIMTARTKPLNVVEPTDEKPGTKVKSFELPPPKTGVKIVETVDELVDLLKNDAKVI